MENLELFYQRLVASIRLLALPYSEQQEYFEDFVDKPFEVVDTFDNAFLHLPKLVELNRFTNLQIAELLRLNNMIIFISTNPSLKDLDDEQFSNSGEWNKIREFAKETLNVLNEVLAKPEPQYL